MTTSSLGVCAIVHAAFTNCRESLTRDSDPSSWYKNGNFIAKLLPRPTTRRVMSAKKLLAFDLGAESGRGVLGRFDGQRLQLEVVHRFPTGGIRTLQTLHWDVLRFHSEMLTALRKCAAEQGGLDSVGVDTWGVDFALLGRGDTL